MRKRIKSVTSLIAGALIVSAVGMSPAIYAGTENGTPNNTKPPLQIVHQTGLKVVVQINDTDTLPNGVSKQVLGTKNLHDQYKSLGMKEGKDYEIVMVFRGDGAQFLLTDAAYDQKVKQPHPKGNPNRAMLDALNKDGVVMYECAVAMKGKGYTPQDILPYSRIVESGITAFVDLQKSGYLPVTP